MKSTRRPHVLTHQELVQINDCYVLLQKGSSEPLPLKELVVCLNSLGVAINVFETAALAKRLKLSKAFTLDNLIEAYNLTKGMKVTGGQIEKATIGLQVNLGKISYDDLRQSLSEVGDIMDDQLLWFFDKRFGGSEEVDWQLIQKFICEEAGQIS